MPMFIIERNFAEEISLDPNDKVILKVNEDVGVKWLYSFLSLDKKKNLLPVRSTQCRSSVRGGTAGECAGGHGHRGRFAGRSCAGSGLNHDIHLERLSK